MHFLLCICKPFNLFAFYFILFYFVVGYDMHLCYFVFFLGCHGNLCVMTLRGTFYCYTRIIHYSSGETHCKLMLYFSYHDQLILGGGSGYVWAILNTCFDIN